MTDLALRVQEAVCERFGIARRELLAPSNRRVGFEPRAVGMLLMREAGESLSEIARTFRRDRATVRHALKAILDVAPKRPKVTDAILDLRDELYDED